MTAIFTGLGAGFARGSGTILGNAGVLGTAATGRGGDNVAVNAATGNLVISRDDEFLVGRGPDRGGFADLQQPRRSSKATTTTSGMSVRARGRGVYGLTGTLNATRARSTRLNGDGSVITYTYGTKGGVSAYWTTDGDGAHDKLVNVARTWVWTDGSSQASETFEVAAVYAGVVPDQGNTDTDGNKLTFTYVTSTNNVDRITTSNDGLANTATGAPEQSYVEYSWVGNNISQIVTGYTDYGSAATEADNVNKTLIRTGYEYDAQNRLKTVTVDLSPEDSAIADGKTYVTTYGYSGSSNRVTSITQTDGSSLTITYDGSNRVQTLTQLEATGVTRLTTLAYGTNYTRVTGADNQETRLDYDSAGQLTKITSPPAYTGATAQEVQFAYNADGDVTSVTDAKGNVTAYEYDSNGNRKLERDASGNTLTRTYGTKNELLTETRYLSAGPGRRGHRGRHRTAHHPLRLRCREPSALRGGSRRPGHQV